MSTSHPTLRPSPAADPAGRPSRAARRTRTVVAACSVPVLVAGGFAMLAVVPVVLAVVGTLREPDLRAFRGWAAALAAAYAVPLVLRAIGPDPGLSLSKSMGPVLTAVLVAVTTVVAIASVVVARRAGATPGR